MTSPIFIAHRGYAAAYPENTLVALDAAQQAGAKYLEVDIQLTADGIPVLFHDRDLQRLCQQTGAIHDYSLVELEKFSVSYNEKFSDKFANNKITTLQTFITYLKERPQVKAFIELKRLMIDTFGMDKVLETLLPMFEGMNQQVSFISYNQEILQRIHNETDFSTGIVVDEWSDYNKNADWQSEWLFCSAQGLPKDNAELEVNTKVAVFEVGNIGLARHLLARGINHLETFCIKEMLQAFAAGKNT